MKKLGFLSALLSLALACQENIPMRGADLDGGTESDLDVDADGDSDIDGDGDSDADSDTDSDTEEEAPCAFECVWGDQECTQTRNGTVVSGRCDQTSQFCCEPGEVDTVSACQYSCVTSGSCSDTEVSGTCSNGQVCCEPGQTTDDDSDDSCPTGFSCPSGFKAVGTGCGCYIQSGLAANKAALWNAGANEYPYMMASAMMETDRALDVDVYIACRDYFGDNWWAGHLWGQAGTMNPSAHADDIRLFKAAMD